MTRVAFIANREESHRIAMALLDRGKVVTCKPVVPVLVANQGSIYVPPRPEPTAEQVEYNRLAAELRQLEASVPKTKKQLKAEKKAKKAQAKLDKFRREHLASSLNRYEFRCC